MPITALAKKLLIMILGTLSTLVPLGARAEISDLPSVKEFPPKVSFEDWRLLSESDFSEQYSLTFLSSVETDFERNNRVVVKAVVPKNRVGKVPVVVLLHYWGAIDNRLEEEMADNLVGKGVASIMLSIPYHLERTPEGYKSGELTIQGDPVKLRETMTQCVMDIKRTLDWVETRPEFDTTRIGISGTSLGAIVSELAFAVEPRFTTGAFVLGGGDLAYILWNSSRVVAQRDQLRREGFTEEKMRSELRPVEPLEFLEESDNRKTFVVQARHDSVIPARSTEILLERLDKPEHLILDSGHYGGALVQGRLLRTVASFFDASFKGSDYKAPQNFYVPTIRFGMMADAETGFNVAASLDVWRLNSSSALFASLMFTPKGARGFIGGNLGGGFSIGAVVLPRKTTFGMTWGTVF